MEGKFEHGGSRIPAVLKVLGQLFGRIGFGHFGHDGTIILRITFLLIAVEG